MYIKNSCRNRRSPHSLLKNHNSYSPSWERERERKLTSGKHCSAVDVSQKLKHFTPRLWRYCAVQNVFLSQSTVKNFSKSFILLIVMFVMIIISVYCLSKHLNSLMVDGTMLPPKIKEHFKPRIHLDPAKITLLTTVKMSGVHAEAYGSQIPTPCDGRGVWSPSLMLCMWWIALIKEWTAMFIWAEQQCHVAAIHHYSWISPLNRGWACHTHGAGREAVILQNNYWS